MQMQQFKRLPIMGILRGIDAQMVEPLSETIIASGLKTVEITMNTVAAPQLIRRMIKKAKRRLMVGAGTVLTRQDLRAALVAGAEFIVMPVLVEDIVEYCAKKRIPVFPGAFTPQEIYNAWCAGATMVKVFPAKFFGPEYLKEIKGPFADIQLLACGGVTAQNIRSFFFSGASAVAFGNSIFRKEWLKNRNYSSIKQGIKALVKAAHRS